MVSTHIESAGSLQAAPAFGPAPLNIDRVIGIFRRHLRLFLAVALTTGLLIALLTLPATPRYTATSTLLINERNSDVLHLNDITPSDAAESLVVADSNAVDTQVEVLRSRALASGVVQQLHLDQDPEFNAALRPAGRTQRLLAMFGSNHKSAAPADPALVQQRQDEGVVDSVMRNLLVRRTGLTYTIDLTYTATDPAKAAAIANAFVQRYLTQGLTTKFDESHAATNWLDTRLNELKQDVQNADAAVERYKISHNLLSAQGATLTEQEISNLDSQLASSRASDAEQDAKLHTAQGQLAAGSNGGDVGEALNNPVVQTLRAQRAQASAQLADLQGRYTDAHPDVIKAKRALADIDSQIQVEIQRVISNLKAQSQVAHSRTSSIAAGAAASRATLAGNNQSMVELDSLQTADDAAKAIYQAFLTRFKEALAKEGTQSADARVLTPAKLPTNPSSPNRKLDSALAVVLGLFAGSLAVLVAETLRSGVSNMAEVESTFDLPALAEIPSLASTLNGARRKADPVQFVAEKPMSRFAESFRNLRTSILASRPSQPVKVVAITSSLPGEGKTTTSMCLARTMALSGSKVVLVDCDLRQRSLNRLLPDLPMVGLLEVLSGAASLEEALVSDADTGAIILPLTRSAFTPEDVFGTSAMTDLLQELRRRFDIVILDTAPVLAVADTRVLCPKADVTVFVARWRRTTKHAIWSALRSLNTPDIFIAGMALTQVNVREQARVGESAAHYYRAYKKYYAE